jgi:hypothetical protein
MHALRSLVLTPPLPAENRHRAREASIVINPHVELNWNRALFHTTMLAALSSSALAFTAAPLSAATTHASRAAQMSPGPSMLETFTTSGLQTDYEEEPTATEWKSRIADGLRSLYPGRGAVRTRTGQRREGKSAEATDAITDVMRDASLADVNWEETLLPSIPQPASHRCISETSWEDRCLPKMGSAAQAPGRLSESSWEDRCLPTLVPAKHVRHRDDYDFSWEDTCLPALPTMMGTGSLSELAWEDRFLP